MGETRPVAVVPVKAQAHAKQRLQPVLDPRHRRGLYRAMLEDVLSTLAGVPRLAQIVLVTGDDAYHDLCQAYGATVLDDEHNSGHSDAVTYAARVLVSRGVNCLLQVPGDIPLVTTAEINALIDAHRSSPAVTICPSHDQRGSNALLCSPPDVIPFQFGDDSFQPHLAGARDKGVDPVVVECQGVSHDIDTPTDLHQFMQSPSNTRAYRYMRTINRLSENRQGAG